MSYLTMNPALARMRTELRQIRYDLAARRFANALLRAKFNANQPRVPAGNPTGGQWTSGGAGGSVDVAANAYGGNLVADFMTGLGRRCVYSFEFGLVAIPGPVNFPCPSWTTSAGTSHGTLLNDNRKMVRR